MIDTPCRAGSGTTQQPVPLLFGWAQHTRVFAGQRGECRFESNVPVSYGVRPPHIHIRVWAPYYGELVTQYYRERGQRNANFDLVLLAERGRWEPRRGGSFSCGWSGCDSRSWGYSRITGLPCHQAFCGSSSQRPFWWQGSLCWAWGCEGRVTFLNGLELRYSRT